MQIEGANPSSKNPVDVTFTVNNLTDNIEVYVLYYCEEHGRWEIVAVNKIDGNQVTAYLHTTSPVALIYKEKGAITTPDGTSPKTGTNSAAVGLGAMAVLFAGFGVYAVKRSRKEA